MEVNHKAKDSDNRAPNFAGNLWIPVRIFSDSVEGAKNSRSEAVAKAWNFFIVAPNRAHEFGIGAIRDDNAPHAS
jgi:hypothetical protein